MGRLPELIGGKYRNLRYFSGGRPFGRLMQEGDYMARKTKGTARKKEGATAKIKKEEISFSIETLQRIKANFEGTLNKGKSDEDIFREHAIKLLEEARQRHLTGQRGGCEDKNWGLIFLGALQAALIAKIAPPDWMAHELYDMITLITSEEAKEGWNDEKVFGNPYLKGKQLGKKGYDCMAECEIGSLLSNEEFIKKHGHKKAEKIDEAVAEILNAEFKELALTARTVKQYRLKHERWLKALISAMGKQFP